MTTLAAAESDFTAESYQLEIPGMDGYRADKLSLGFAGSVDLDRTSQEDLDFVNGLKLGRELKLLVTAVVTKKGFTLTTGKDEGPDSTGYGVGLKVHSLEVV